MVIGHVLNITDAEVMIDGEGFTEWSGNRLSRDTEFVLRGDED